MSARTDPFEELTCEVGQDDFVSIVAKPIRETRPPVPITRGAPATARFCGFDLQDRPLLGGLPDLADEVVVARTTVALRGIEVGASVVVLFDQGNPRLPIIVGRLQGVTSTPSAEQIESVSVAVDGEQFVVNAEREIVLRCGAASITLTRAGKVIIKGSYIISRSTGYNRIKGAAVDIN